MIDLITIVIIKVIILIKIVMIIIYTFRGTYLIQSQTIQMFMSDAQQMITSSESHANHHHHH